MNCRERFLNVMNFKEVDRILNYELGLWPQTYERWIKEGLPEDVLYGNFFSGEEFFKLDRREFIPIRCNMIPVFEEETLKEGIVRGGRFSMDQYLKFSVENEDDFEDIKKRYNPKSPTLKNLLCHIIKE